MEGRGGLWQYGNRDGRQSPSAWRIALQPDDDDHYVQGRPTRRRARIRRRGGILENAETDDDATFDTVVTLQAEEIAQAWGIQASHLGLLLSRIRRRSAIRSSAPARRKSALAYMGLKSGVPLTEVAIDKVFIGSCTNSRIKIYAAAEIAKDAALARQALPSRPGPVACRRKPKVLDKIFIDAGFGGAYRAAPCLAMNNDRLIPRTLLLTPQP